MPQSKLAFIRYMLIDQMLRNKHKPYPTKEDLLEACAERFGVRSISTIEKDLNAMRMEFEAPIEYSKREKGYYYSDPEFKFLSVNLSDDQLKALSFVETFLQEFKFMPIFSEFSDAVDKVLDGLEITRNFGNDLKSVNQFIQIDKSPYYKGSDILSRLIKLISNQKTVRIRYQKFGSEQDKDYVIHPYLLKEFRNFWYLVGYVADYKEVRTFGVDRILDAEEAGIPYIPETEVNFQAQSFFKYCYGITALDGRPERVVLSFSVFRGNYIKSQPIHPSQQILADNDQELRIELHLINNFELRDLILSYGSHVRVIEPISLAEQIKKAIADSLKNYH
jgi:predicted DNA-binding transcriptional regulator YafY